MTGHSVAGVRFAVDVGFQAARARLRSLAKCGLLACACEVAYGEATAGLATGPTRLADVYLQDLTGTGDCPLIAFQWQAIAADGRMFTALLADLTLVPAEDEVMALSVTGTYWPPPGPAGAEPCLATGRGQATAVMDRFLDLVGCQLAHPAGTRSETIN